MNFEEQPRTNVISTQQNTDYLYSRLVAVGTDTRKTTPKNALSADKATTLTQDAIEIERDSTNLRQSVMPNS
jgi:hypothetical protein